MSVFECVRAREVFLAAYSNATLQGNSHDLAVKLGLDAVWMAGRQYQAAQQEAPAQNTAVGVLECRLRLHTPQSMNTPHRPR